MLPGKRYTPEELLSLLWRWRLLLVAATIVATGLAAGAAWLLPDRYRSETVILVVPQRVPDSYVKGTVTMRIEDRLKSLSQEILGQVRLERLINEFDLYPELRARLPISDVVERMRLDAEVKVIKGDAFQVAYVSQSPQTAQIVAERLAAQFIEENLKDREVVAEDTSKFLDSQLTQARARLVEQEKRLEEFRRTYHGQLPSQMEGNQRALQNVELQIQALLDATSRDRDRKLMLERELADMRAVPSPGAAPAREASAAQGGTPPRVRLDAARAAFAELQSRRLTDQHPDVIRVRKEIQALEREVAGDASASAAAAPALSPADLLAQNRRRQIQLEVENVERQLVHRQNEERRLRGVAADLETRISAGPARESELISLTRDYDTIRQIYSTLLAKKEDSKIAANVERQRIGEQFRILDPARVPERPTSPNRPLIVGAGAFAGLLLGIVLIAALEFRNAGLRNEDEASACIELPVLAVIPALALAGRPPRRRLWKALKAGAVAGAVLFWLSH